MPSTELPISLQQKANALFVRHFATLVHPMSPYVQCLLHISDYACRHINLLQTLLQEDGCRHQLMNTDYQALILQIPLDLPVPAFMRQLRLFRNRHLLRLLLRELGGLASTEETMAAWSDCADALILHALAYCERQSEQRYGKPREQSGNVAKIYMLAMGKLGGRELNFSSDVDLIFAFSAAGNTDGAESITNQQYYSKVVQQLMQLLQQVTIDGFVFRVDARLRPNGDSGNLVCSLAAMETYYQEQGRDWERYAMVKARLLGENCDNSHWFNRLIIPFVYRRYVDFSVIESLRSMKAMIEREVQLKPMLDDIKRGRGGIREVEFIIQSFQLIRGGRLPLIQHQNAMAALGALKHEKLLAHTTALQQAYLFLRKLENALQTQNDQQTHSLPTDAAVQAQIVIAMGCESWDNLLVTLDQYRRIISLAFNAVLSQTDGYEDEKRLFTHQLSSLWQGHVETSMAINLLASLDYQQPERCYQMIHAFRHGPRCRRLTQAARMRLDRFMVLLLGELVQVPETDVVLLQVLRLLENIVGRSAYLALLTENKPVLQELLHWFAHSPFITTLLVEHPFLLEVLIDQHQTWRPLTRKQLRLVLQAKLAHAADTEAQDEILRQFKLTCWLLAARAELYGQCGAVMVARFLADVAEIVIVEVFTQACRQLANRYPEIMSIKSRFAIVAYGKLGSREMNYDSDLDLVFLHAATPAEEGMVIRLTQKILHMLTIRSQSGILYAVDTRLRPSGTAGLLVSHVDAFAEYQLTQAWTWEHQALVRARVISANKQIRERFTRLKSDVLFLPRDRATLAEDVRAMRVRISKHLELEHIKYVPGGLLDLEFLVQFLVLTHPQQQFVRHTNTLSQLRLLFSANVLSKTQFSRLKRVYNYYHQLLHQHLLQPCPRDSDSFQAEVVAISQEFY